MYIQKLDILDDYNQAILNDIGDRFSSTTPLNSKECGYWVAWDAGII